jgi:hypothetical protein
LENQPAFVPHSGQNFAPGNSLAPHSLQKAWVAIFAPQFGQNFALAARGASHCGQVAWMTSFIVTFFI